MAAVSQSLPRKSLRESVPLTKEILEALEDRGYISDGVLTKGDHSGERPIYSDQLPPEIDLSNTDITDVSCLIYVDKLTLRHCGSLVDLSPFAKGTVRDLNLSYCWSVTDVSALRYVSEIDLTGCRYVTNVASLRSGCVETLKLGFITVRDIASLKGSTTLKYIELYKGVDNVDVAALTSIPTLTTLKIYNCYTVTDISPVASSNIEKFFTQGCCGIVDISSLDKNKTLKRVTFRASNVVDVSALGHLQELEYVDLSWNLKIVDVSMLYNVKTLKLSGCKSIHSIAGLEQGMIVNLCIDDCPNITDVSMLWKAKSLISLDISQTGVANVSSLGWSKTLEYLALEYCKNITDISGLKGCKSLKEIRLSRKLKGLEELKDVVIDMEFDEDMEDEEDSESD